jgi:hypothetical protein
MTLAGYWIVIESAADHSRIVTEVVYYPNSDHVGLFASSAAVPEILILPFDNERIDRDCSG